MSNIKVGVKVRPLIEREKNSGELVCWKVVNNRIGQLDPTTGRSVGPDGYVFDHVFDTHVSNQEIFSSLVKPLVDSTIQGFNATIFAYGQTASGKTYTMTGSKDEPGIIPLAVSTMFQTMQHSPGREFLVRASYIEIYNEKINDLLDGKKNLKIREEDGKAVVVGLKEELVTTTEKVLLLMKRGQKNRNIGETNMNKRSSRSHTIFRIVVESQKARRDQDRGETEDGVIKVSHLNLVDLAGSERVYLTGSEVGSERFREGCNINLSLFTLSHVISQLSEGKRYVNFRDSKLTRILEPALGGNAVTAIICNITPVSIDETHCTLRFASRAKKIKNDPHVNEVFSEGTLLKRYALQLTRLKEELEKAKTQNCVQEMESKLQEKDRLNDLLQARIDRLSEQLIGRPINTPYETKDKKSLRRKTWAGRRASCVPLVQKLYPITESPTTPLSGTLRKELLEDNIFQIPFEEFERDLIESEIVASTPSFSSKTDSSESNNYFCFGDSKSDICRFSDQCEQIETDVEHETICLDYNNYCEQSTQTDVVKLEQSQLYNEGYCSCCKKNSVERLNDASCQIDAAINGVPDATDMNVQGETPPHLIRANLKALQNEYEELQEFTRLEQLMYSEKPELVSVAVQTVTPCCDNYEEARVEEAVTHMKHEDNLLVELEIDKAIKTLDKSTTTTDFVADENEETKLVTNSHCDISKQDQHSISDLQTRLSDLIEENSLQKAELAVLQADNEKLKNMMLSEMNTLCQGRQDVHTESSNNTAIFSSFLNCIMQKEQEVVNALNDQFTGITNQKQSWINNLEKQVDSLENQLKILNDERQRLDNDLILQKKSVKKLEASKLHLNSLLTKLESDFSFLQDENRDLNQKLKLSEEKVLSVDSTVNSLTKTLQFEREEKEKYKYELAQMQDRYLETCKTSENILSNDKSLLLEISVLNDEVKKLTSEKDSLKESLKLSSVAYEKEKHAAIQKTECLKIIRNQLMSIVFEFSDSQKKPLYDFQAILTFLKDKLTQPCGKCRETNLELQTARNELECVKRELAEILVKQNEIEQKNDHMLKELNCLRNEETLCQGETVIQSDAVSCLVSGVSLEKATNFLQQKKLNEAESICNDGNLDTSQESVPTASDSGQIEFSSVGVNTTDVCKCGELQEENEKLMQETVTTKLEMAKIQEELEYQQKETKFKIAELKTANFKIRNYKMELQRLQNFNETYSQKTHSKDFCDSSCQTDDYSMFVRHGSGIITESLVRDLRASVLDLKKKNDTLKAVYVLHKDKIQMLEGKITELSGGQKKTMCNARVQTECVPRELYCDKFVQVEIDLEGASPYKETQLLIWQIKANDRLEEIKMLKSLICKQRKEISELKEKTRPLEELNFNLPSEPELCIRPSGVKNNADGKKYKYPYINK